MRSREIYSRPLSVNGYGTIIKYSKLFFVSVPLVRVILVVVNTSLYIQVFTVVLLHNCSGLFSAYFVFAISCNSSLIVLTLLIFSIDSICHLQPPLIGMLSGFLAPFQSTTLLAEKRG